MGDRKSIETVIALLNMFIENTLWTGERALMFDHRKIDRLVDYPAVAKEMNAGGEGLHAVSWFWAHFSVNDMPAAANDSIL